MRDQRMGVRMDCTENPVKPVSILSRRKPVRQRFPYTDAVWDRPAHESDWHELRALDITATDAAALFGVSPYSTYFELYQRKIGALDATFEESERMRWGRRLQAAIAEGICEDMGWRILSDHPWLYVRSRRFVGMGASPDYVVFDPMRGLPGLLEIKNVDRFVARDQWADDDDGPEAPPHIEFQLQHQLECSELPWGAIGGLIGGNEARVIVRERDEAVGIEIGNRVTELWRRVRDEDPPQPDYLADAETLKRLYKHATVGAVMDLADPKNANLAPKVIDLFAAKRAADAAKKAAVEDATRVDAELLDTIREMETVMLPDGRTIRAATQYVEERTQVVKAHAKRRLYLKDAPKAKGR